MSCVFFLPQPVSRIVMAIPVRHPNVICLMLVLPVPSKASGPPAGDSGLRRTDAWARSDGFSRSPLPTVRVWPEKALKRSLRTSHPYGSQVRRLPYGSCFDAASFHRGRLLFPALPSPFHPHARQARQDKECQGNEHKRPHPRVPALVRGRLRGGRRGHRPCRQLSRCGRRARPWQAPGRGQRPAGRDGQPREQLVPRRRPLAKSAAEGSHGIPDPPGHCAVPTPRRNQDPRASS